MSFFESPRFPERIAMGALGGPQFSTSVAGVYSGAEQRNGAWSYPLHRWDVSQGLRNQADFESVRAFFLAARGRLHGWRFKDWTDYAATHASGVVSGLTSTTFELAKRYSSGAQTLDRRIRKPIASGFELKNSGVTLVSGVDYTLSTVTGVVTTAVPRVAANLTWAGEFDVPMRFDTDHLQARVEARNPAAGLLHRWEAIPVLEIRV